MADIERQLVTIRTVSEIKPIPNADNICLAIVDGWQCVVKKGEFNVGDKGVYFEIDSFLPIPENPEDKSSPFEFLRKDSRYWNGMYGARIRTIKLRGQISQGLLLPFTGTNLPKNLAKHYGVVKWEKIEVNQEVRKDSWIDPIIRFLVPKKYRPAVFNFIYKSWFFKRSGKGPSSWPSFLVKTDQERIQNVLNQKLTSTEVYEASNKMDGSSMTVYVYGGKFGFCSRNCKLGIGDGSNFAKVVEKYEMHKKLPEFFGSSNFAIQGELCGPGVQENYEQLDDHDFFVFDIFDIDKQEYLIPKARMDMLEELARSGLLLKSVPILGEVSLDQFKSIDDYLAFAEGPSYKNPKREGVVFKRVTGGDSFKCVANSYLIKEK